MMKRNRASDLRLSIESATEDAIAKSGIDAVRDVFAMYGARSADDLPEDYYEQVFSDLMLLVSD